MEVLEADDSSKCAAWRALLVDDEQFMAMTLDLARNFLLLTRVAAKPGRRRILTISYEHT